MSSYFPELLKTHIFTLQTFRSHFGSFFCASLSHCNTTQNPGNRLLITWVNILFQIKDRYLSSIHFWDSGLWQVLDFP